ncbi:hypothetical protein F2Q68_00009734 [Brassica cretica]|uniref:Reverse transcriptase zinc-binding domain-containing protein n=1 Tax=Brassica cretica TaxID=69181 RepID=A0A8S9KTI4_BRACR|nr:hypothetical protein F2Q68_00009734 [Brassica cretica]
MPHVEEKLWSSIWKIKAPPKIKNFIWRSLSGALAVKERLEEKICQAVPWILWQIWKARNSQTFKATVVPPRQSTTLSLDEAELWISEISPQVDKEQAPNVKLWSKPPVGAFKCNVGIDWIDAHRKCGVSWILRDTQDKTISHSRRSYSTIWTLREASLRAIFWAVERLFPHLNWIITQINAMLECIEFWRLDHAAVESNEAANLIAQSVTTGHRYQSYIASQGPAWLQSLLTLEGQSH